jgi:hypothetical protein
MKVGDLVIRKKRIDDVLNVTLGLGLILSKQLGGSNPVHPCITVYYPEMGRTWDIAESLVEVINERKL